MNAPLQLVLTVLFGAGGFAAIVVAVLARRKTHADSEFSYGGAWEKFVTSQDRALEAVKAENERMRGQLDSANHRLLILERQRNEALFWQAQVTSREGVVAALLASRGIDVPPMPAPPIMREYTRAEDREAPQ